MRHVLCAVMLISGLALSVQARENLTVLVRVDDQLSPKSFEAMKAELKGMLDDVDIEWRSLSDVRLGDTFPDLVVVRFKGACEMDSIPPYLIDERGPTSLAFTHTADGQVLPFSEVECDRIRVAIRSVMHGDDFRHANALLGRAMGRVLAHELHHVLQNTKSHEKTGVNRSELTPTQLIAEQRP